MRHAIAGLHCAAVKSRRLAFAIAMAALLLGAAGPPSALDGTYSGTSGYGTARNAKAKCTIAYPANLHVAGGTASIYWNGPLTGAVTPDGKVNITGSNGSTVTGVIAGNTFKGTIDGAYCSFQVELNKS